MQHPEDLCLENTGDEPTDVDKQAYQGFAHLAEAGGSPTGRNMKGAHLMGADLSGQNLNGANLEGAILLNANLSGANLLKANLKNAELSGADLTGANLEWADLTKAGLGKAVLTRARMFHATLDYATLNGADLHEADLRSASLQQARLHEADLQQVDFTTADLSGTDLSEAHVGHASFEKSNLQRANLHGVTGFESASWIGTDMRDINFSGAYLLQRFARDQNYIKEFRDRSPYTRFIYYIWWISSDCGRSILRWLALLCMVALVYAGLYTQVEMNYLSQSPSWFTPIYYSVVTMTSLGYGDILPVTVTGQILAVTEVLLGYVMLGGLLSIFANKLARRAD